MYKSIHNKNFTWCLAINTFKKEAKKISNVYHTGIHWWKCDNRFITITFVISTFRILITFPIGKDVGCNC